MVSENISRIWWFSAHHHDRFVFLGSISSNIIYEELLSLLSELHTLCEEALESKIFTECWRFSFKEKAMGQVYVTHLQSCVFTKSRLFNPRLVHILSFGEWHVICLEFVHSNKPAIYFENVVIQCVWSWVISFILLFVRLVFANSSAISFLPIPTWLGI